MSKDIYQDVTNRIVADLEKGVRPWQKPWSGEAAAGRVVRPLRHNGLAYSGINILLLWSRAVAQGYTSPTWMTFRQAKALGAHVREREKGALVVYANTLTKAETDPETGEETEHEIPYMKGYAVFNVEQIEGLPTGYFVGAAEPVEPVARNAAAEAFFTATGADIRVGGAEACYAVTHDFVRVPPIEAFIDPESYYATLAHEVTHWTRHPNRLNRNFGRKRWGDEGYAMEELVAELGAAFLSADLALTPEPREDHAAYIEAWLRVLKRDTRAIFQAAAHAQRAADYLHGLQAGNDTADEAA